MNTQKISNGRKGAHQDNLQDKLIPFPVPNGAAIRNDDSLWPVLARHRGNPFVRFVRTVFYYPDDFAHGAARGGGLSSPSYFHGKTLVH